ncbi:glucose-1-phosphate cytidylyltransferase [Hyphomicrobium sp.]|jgi:glucose-1-phosphate cytidylyltransferase|uniref:glucose-1-phosphate cytidylyltransferase n=1 Tax=Hyphomicrobium sp. TaxID=82 RepID=UPI003569268B
MKAVILAGGRGTRISEESLLRPKPMIEIGGKPILWHIMKTYSAAGINDFVVCLGYKGYQIKEYFANYFLHTSDVTFDVKENKMEVHAKHAESWRVTLVDTGLETMTGGRIKRVAPYIGDDDFCMTYGDGVSDIDIPKLLEFHRTRGLAASVTVVQPQGRFGSVFVDGEEGRVTKFEEKPAGDGRWVNAGFFVLSPKVFDYIEGDSTIWERDPLDGLARDGQLGAFRHSGFWQAMDTMREREHLEELWSSGNAPWKTWST